MLGKKRLNFNNVSTSGGTGIHCTEFPGVYAHLILSEEIGTKLPWFEDVHLIFSKVLLRQRNYHVNFVDQNGAINENTIVRSRLMNSSRLMKTDNEIVFHDPISLKALQAIYVRNKKSYDELYKRLKNTGYEKLMILSDTYPNKNFNKYCDLPADETNKRGITDTSLRPNLAYCIPKNAPKYVYSKFLDNANLRSLRMIKIRSILNIALIRRCEFYAYNPKERPVPKWLPGVNLY
jgi:hypothetical protein